MFYSTIMIMWNAYKVVIWFWILMKVATVISSSRVFVKWFEMLMVFEFTILRVILIISTSFMLSWRRYIMVCVWRKILTYNTFCVILTSTLLLSLCQSLLMFDIIMYCTSLWQVQIFHILGCVWFAKA